MNPDDSAVARGWQWLRSMLFQVLLVLSVLVFGLPVLALLVLPDGNARWRAAYGIARAWSGTVLWLLRVICGITHEVHGRYWLPSTPSVVLMKHQSAWETIAQFRIFPPQCWVLKKELMSVPVFGWALNALRPIPIERARGKVALRSVVETGRRRLADGIWVVVFPEGTRVAPGEPRRYRIGGASLATAASRPVVPVAHNAGSCWPSGTLIKTPGVITVSIGPPIDTRDRHPEDVLAQTREWIEREQLLLDPVRGGDA